MTTKTFFRNLFASGLLCLCSSLLGPSSAFAVGVTIGYIDEIQVLNDTENGTPYRYALVYLTPPGGAQAAYILPLPNSEQLSLLMSAQAAAKRVYLSGNSNWGMMPSSVIGSNVVATKIDRVIVYTQ